MAEANCGRSGSDLSDAIDHVCKVFCKEFYFEESGGDLDDIDWPPVQLGLAPYKFEPVK